MAALSWILATVLLQNVFSQYVDPPNYGWGVRTSLDDYVHREDGAFSWTRITSYRYEEQRVTTWIINMTSQLWMDASYVSRPVWWHFMAISIPDVLERTDVASIFITGGDNNNDVPGVDDGRVLVTVEFANLTHAITGSIRQVPNQPIVFANDPTGQERYEDQGIAYSWKIFMDNYYNASTHNPDVVYRNPMTKAAKRGLDTIAELAAEEIAGAVVDKFLVYGISKRGWTTWSLAATDRRVIATCPQVFSFLHMEDSVMSHYRALNGAWSFALFDYFNEGLTPYFTEPQSRDDGGLFTLEDMYRYRARLTMPKLLIVSTGDQFFLLQDTHYFLENMTGPMYMLMLPNTGHDTRPWHTRITDTVAGFWLTILRGLPFPQLTWRRSEFANTGEIVLESRGMTPDLVVGWQSVTLQNDTRRDWRIHSGWPEVGAHVVPWVNSSVEDLGNGVYRQVIDKVPGEWAAHLIEAHYEGPEGLNMVFTTEVNVVPETFLVPACEGIDCTGYLV